VPKRTVLVSSYGYVSSTRVKFVLIFEHSTAISLKDTDIKLLFQRLHQAYIDCILNPFYQPNSQLKSKRFEQVVSSLMIQTDSMMTSLSSPTAASLTA
jgi:trafficking protein particle complex subunit 2